MKSVVFQTAAVMLMVAAFVVVAVIAITDANTKAEQVAATQQQLNAVLIRSCNDNGNPLRLAVQQMIRDEIKQSKAHPALLRKAFPQLSTKRLHRLIHQANQQRRKELRSIAPVDCHALYH